MVRGSEFHGLFGRLGFLICGGDAAKRFSLLPPNVVLMTVGGVDLLVRGFPEVTITGGGGELVPLLGFVRVIS